MFNKKRLTQIISGLVVAALIIVVIVAVSGGKPNAAATTGNGKVSGTLTFAEGATANPNWIFPFESCQYCSVDNINQFQDEMFRPMYWFGLGGSVSLVPSLSLAYNPVYSNHDKTVTMKLKGWKFADGQTVNAQSVMFFLNMYKALPKDFWGYNPGYGIPDQVASITGKDMTVTINFKTTVNPLWITNNYLNQITPFTDNWDRSSATQKSDCATGLWGAKSTDTACTAVYNYLNNLSSKTTSYTDKLWQSGDDGPWRLTSFDNLGNLTFQPNNKYSGPVKAKVAYVKEIAYTTTQAEENDLQAGKLDIGFVDPGVLTSPAPSPGKVGPNWGNLASKYNLSTGTIWGFNYAPFNFNAKDPKVAAVNQLYIRQALQESTDQTGVIKNVDKGYGFPSYTALPAVVPAKFSAPIANPYPFNLTSAKNLLSSHGWKIENGVQTCVDPGTGATQCGAGITQGYTLSFTFVYASGTPSLTQEITAEVADWAQIGIKVGTSTESFNSVVADCSSGAGFQLCMWGGGWTFSPNYFPTGETLFAVGGGFNPGDYANKTMTSLIKGTDFGHSNLTQYATFAAQNLPVLYEPESAPTVETIKTLHSSIGWTGSPLLNFMPEYYSFN
jgi:peptide/nickel transport system substrate-binding protein